MWLGFTIFISLSPKVTSTRISPIIRISLTPSYNIQLISRSMSYLIDCPKSWPSARSRLRNKTTFQVAWSLYPKSFTIHIYRCYQSRTSLGILSLSRRNLQISINLKKGIIRTIHIGKRPSAKISP